jgi:Holliday junction resolvase RusA-like endonuclease
MDVTFEVPLSPHGKLRPRFGRGTVRTPEKTKSYEKAVAMAAYSKLNQYAPIVRPLVVDILALKRRPKMLFGCDEVLLPAPVTPDKDNIAKAVYDGMSRFLDETRGDAIIVAGTDLKAYAPKGMNPCVRVRVRLCPGDLAEIASGLGLWGPEFFLDNKNTHK